MKRILIALTLAGCGRADDPQYGGFYAVEATPATQQCGNATFTFIGDVILVNVEGGVLETDWNGDLQVDSTGTIAGNDFVQVWTEVDVEPIPCLATGAASVVTTYQNEWTGAFGRDSFESTLRQTIDDDCGVINACALEWQLLGERTQL